MDETALLQDLFTTQRAARRSAGMPDAALRRDRLDRCVRLLLVHQDSIAAALDADYGSRSRRVTQLAEIYGSVATLRHARANLARWMQPRRQPLELALALTGARAEIRYEPKGVVGIASPWNFPVNLSFAPLAGALAAGNSAIVKVSEHTPRTATLLARLVEKHFATEELSFVCGGPAFGAAFAQLPWDHLLFTGGTETGRAVMAAAAGNLTPVTLELGGKSPVIVGKGADLTLAADRILAGKIMNAGQICLAPDYLLIEKERLPALLDGFRRSASRFTTGFATAPDFGAIINEGQRDRLHALLADAGASGGTILPLTGEADARACATAGRLPPTLVIDPGPQARILREEIFGPLLLILTRPSLAEMLAVVRSRPTPLALYYFGRDRREQEAVLTQIPSGGVTINDIILHAGIEDLPLGGVGASGMGAYHGHRGFLEFSHQRALFRQGYIDIGRILRPPYGPWFDRALRWRLRG